MGRFLPGQMRPVDPGDMFWCAAIGLGLYGHGEPGESPVVGTSISFVMKCPACPDDHPLDVAVDTGHLAALLGQVAAYRGRMGVGERDQFDALALESGKLWSDGMREAGL